MTPPPPPETLSREQMIARLETAAKEFDHVVTRFFRRDYPVLRASIPARPDEDSDLIIGNAISDVLAALRASPPQACPHGNLGCSGRTNSTAPPERPAQDETTDTRTP